MMRVALVQVGDDLDVAPGVMRVGWVTTGWGGRSKAISYLQFDVPHIIKVRNEQWMTACLYQ